MKTGLFEQKVWEALKSIPKGKVSTYKAIAEYIGSPGSARAVGNALKKNPDSPVVPCHRIIRSDGRIGGYRYGTIRKTKLLIGEGIRIDSEGIVNLAKYVFRFKRKLED